MTFKDMYMAASSTIDMGGRAATRCDTYRPGGLSVSFNHMAASIMIDRGTELLIDAPKARVG